MARADHDHPDLAADEFQLVEAVRAAASDLRASGPLPARSEDALRLAVRDRLRDAGTRDVAHETHSITGGWAPIPGRLDLHAGVSRPLRWAAEAKVWDIGQQIWDALKLAAGISQGDLQVGYLIAASTPTAFAEYGGAELYAPGMHDYDVRSLLLANAVDWQHDLGGGTGRPTDLPAAIRTTLLADEWCWFGHRARLVRVELSAGDAPTLRFEAGWPEGTDGPAAVAALKARPRRATRDALGLAVPARWNARWWRGQLQRGVSREQFEALYGLLLTRGWTDDQLRARVTAPEGCAPPWWSAGANAK